ncbi:MAG: protease complex subunit PrcB family protein [Chthonomonadales bacterium]
METMWTRTIWLAVVALLACPIALAQNGGKPKPPSKEPGTVPLLDIHGAMSNIRQQRQVIVRNSEEWKQLWRQHAGTARAPIVDFSRYDVVAVFTGAKPTGGYQVRIDTVRVEPKKKEAFVNVTLLKPARSAVTIQVFTFPFAMKAVPKLPQNVHFILHEAEANEGPAH